MEVQKGIIQSMTGTTATVVPNDRPEIVTQPLIVPFYWRETMGNLKPGDEVYFLEDDGHGGYIIGRTDGNWDNTLRGTLTVTEDITGKANMKITGNVSAIGNMISAGDVKAGAISLSAHNHKGDSGGETSPPK